MKSSFLLATRVPLSLRARREIILRRLRQLDRDIDRLRAARGLPPLPSTLPTLRVQP